MRIACCQLEAKTMETAASVWPALQKQVTNAAENGADLMVFPEIAYPAYSLESRERYFAEDVERSDAVLRRFSDIARRSASWIVAGFVEETDDDLFNSAAVFDRTGQLVDVARKQVMWDCDQDWFSPGNAVTVVGAEFGNIGVLICADMRMPEVAATLASRGAGIIVQPTAWVNAGRPNGPMRNVQVEFMIKARALEFGVPIASCSKSGRETPRMAYVGQSMIVDAAGNSLAVAPATGDAMIVADVECAPGPGVAISPEDHRDLLTLKPVQADESAHSPMSINLKQEVDSIQRELRNAGVRAQLFTPEDLQSFVQPRLATLRGVQVLLSHGEMPDQAIMRTRAVENRVFLIASQTAGPTVAIDPNGEFLSPDQTGNVELRIGEANQKRFTPRTPIWSQRRPAGYEFAATDVAQSS